MAKGLLKASAYRARGAHICRGLLGGALPAAQVQGLTPPGACTGPIQVVAVMPAWGGAVTNQKSGHGEAGWLALSRIAGPRTAGRAGSGLSGTRATCLVLHALPSVTQKCTARGGAATTVLFPIFLAVPKGSPAPISSHSLCLTLRPRNRWPAPCLCFCTFHAPGTARQEVIGEVISPTGSQGGSPTWPWVAALDSSLRSITLTLSHLRGQLPKPPVTSGGVGV